jgi:DNA polymerase (family 10)
VSTLDAKGLRQIPNVGTSIAEKTVEFVASGHIQAVEQLRGKVPAGVLDLTRIPGLGPKKAMMLSEDLGVTSIGALRDAIRAGRLESHQGFGARSAENILHGIAWLEHGQGRVLVSVATEIADEVIAGLSAVPGCRRVAYAGSLRRMRETIGDVDVLAAATDADPVMAAFTELPLVAEVIAHGPTKSSTRTAGGLQVDLRVVEPAAWGAALQYFTGSKPHNIRLREIAIRQGLKLSEYGLFRVDDGALIVSEDEQQVYHRLGLPWIPPTLREDRGEVETALAGELPDLVTERDIRGDLHTHTI